MWLPRTIYEALPALYWVIGAIMIALLIYVRDGGVWSFVYGATAVICLAGGTIVYMRRRSFRRNGKNSPIADQQ